MGTTALLSRLIEYVLAACLISVLATASTPNQLPGSNKRITAFKVHSDMSCDQFEDTLKEIKLKVFEGVTVNALMIRYRILLLSGTPPPDIQSKLTELARDRDQNAKVVKIPLQEDADHHISIPTGELIVQFKGDVGDAKAVSILAPLNLRINEYPRKDTPGRYRVADRDDDFLRLSRSAQTLAKNDSIRFVEPDTLEIMRKPSESPF